MRVRLLLDDTHQTEEIVLDRGARRHPISRFVSSTRWRIGAGGIEFPGDFGRVNNRMHTSCSSSTTPWELRADATSRTSISAQADHNFRDLDVAVAGPMVRGNLSASFDLFWNSEWAVLQGAVVAAHATEQDFRR